MKFSFIIPVYNTGHLLKKCIQSIVASGFSDFEIIVIDDGSTDNSAETIGSIAKGHTQINVITQTNQGQGVARNAGIRSARGDYLWFVDSDDWLLDGAVGRTVQSLNWHNPDVMVLNYVVADESGKITPNIDIPGYLVGKICTPAVDQNVFAAVSCWNAPPWRLVCRRSLVIENNIVFAEGVFYEDHPFAIHLMLLAEKVYVSPALSYTYFSRQGSTTKNNDRKVFDFLKVRKICLGLFDRFGKWDGFSNVVSSYIAPLNFYIAHVQNEYKREFAVSLGQDITDKQLKLLKTAGDVDLIKFASSAKLGNAFAPDSPLARRLSLPFSAYGRQRMRTAIKMRTRSHLRWGIRRLRDLASRTVQSIETGQPSQRHYRLGWGSKLEHARIDVRVAPENRDYLIVGQNSLVGGYYVFERGLGSVSIGDATSVGSGTMFVCTQSQGIAIGNQVLISWDVTFIDSNSHSLDPEIRSNDALEWLASIDAGQIGMFKDWGNVDSAPIVVEDRAWIGFGATIMKGVTIGKGAIVAAKSVVTKSVAPYTIVGGNPARFIGYVPRERWDWEDTLAAAHGDPAMIDTMRYAYLHSNHHASLDLYRGSREFFEVRVALAAKGKQRGRLLDVGAGNGVCAAAFALDFYDVVALEPGNGPIGGIAAIESMASVAQSIDASVTGRLHWQRNDILDYTSDEAFDIVFCRQALHHFLDPYAAVRRIHDLLKPGGVALFLREHVVFDEEDKRRFLDGHPFQKFYGGENAYTVEEYTDFIVKGGLYIEQTMAFAESPINYEPHAKETVQALSELEVSGRPYSFIALKPDL